MLDDGSSQPTDAQSHAQATPQPSPDARPSGRDGVDCALLPASPVAERQAQALRRMPSGRASIPGDKATPKGGQAANPSADDLPVLPISPAPENLKADDARSKLARPPGLRDGATGEQHDSLAASPGRKDKGKNVRRAEKAGDTSVRRKEPSSTPAKGGSPARA